MERYLVAFLVAVSLTSLALPITLKILRKRGYLDSPNERSSHVVPTPRGAGFSQVVGGAGALLSSGGLPLSALVGLAGYSALGAADDLKTRPPLLRLTLQFVVAIAAVVLAQSSWGLSGWGLVAIGAAAVVAFVVLVNAANFMDGINGISVIHGGIFGSFYGAILWRAGLPEWAPLGAILAGVSLAVLPWNWGSSAKIFLGDSGSYLLGSSVAVLFIAVWLLGPGLLVAVAPVTVYLVDIVSTLIQRMRRHESLMNAHRDHVYQRLVRCGWSHPRTAAFVGALSSLAGLIALGLQQDTIPIAAGILLLVLLGVAYLATPKIVGAGSK